MIGNIDSIRLERELSDLESAISGYVKVARNSNVADKSIKLLKKATRKLGHVRKILSQITVKPLVEGSRENAAKNTERVRNATSKVFSNIGKIAHEVSEGLSSEAIVLSMRLGYLNPYINSIAMAVNPSIPSIYGPGGDISTFDIAGPACSCIAEGVSGILGTIALVHSSVKLEELRKEIKKNKLKQAIEPKDGAENERLKKTINNMQSAYHNGVFQASMLGGIVGISNARVALQVALPITSDIATLAGSSMSSVLAVVAITMSAHSIHQDYKLGKAVNRELTTLCNLDQAVEKNNNSDIKSVLNDMRSFRTRRLLRQKEDIRMRNIRNGMAIAGSSALFASSILAIVSVGTVGGIAAAAAVTGIGALVVGALALTIGIGYLIYRYRRTIAIFFKTIAAKILAHGDNKNLTALREEGRIVRMIDKMDLIKFKSNESIKKSRNTFLRLKNTLKSQDRLSDENTMLLQRYTERLKSCDIMLAKITQEKVQDFEAHLKKVLATEEGKAAIKTVMPEGEFIGDDLAELSKQVERYLIEDTRF